ncbi:MAG: hypothetical protein DRO93_14215, partial [Candidatus Thorarchaeota archaeon]
MKKILQCFLLCFAVATLPVLGTEGTVGEVGPVFGPEVPQAVQREIAQYECRIITKTYSSFFSLYDANYHAGIPQFITTDCALYLSHVAVSASIRALELGYMSPTLH